MLATGTGPICDAAAEEVPAASNPEPKVGRKLLSICIPAFNEARNIEALLGFLRRQDLGDYTIMQVLVEASGSTDGSLAAISRVAKTWDRVTLLPVGKRLGLAAALDRLIGEARGEVVLRVDGDVALDGDSIPLILSAFDSPSVGIVGPRIVPCRTGNRVCDLLASTEYELHHQISSRYPKTTVVQAFRRLPLHIPPDVGSEDVYVQNAILGAGFAAVYASGARATIRPPSRLGEFVRQRVRTVQANLRATKFVRMRASTQRLGSVAGGARLGLRNGTLTIFGLVCFAAIEAFAQLAAGLLSLSSTGTGVITFAPLATTKGPTWEDYSSAATGLQPTRRE